MPEPKSKRGLEQFSVFRSFGIVLFIICAFGAAVQAGAQEIDVLGNSVSIPNGDATPGAADHTVFGTQNVASGTLSRTFTIENTGAGALNLETNAVTILGVNSADFTVIAQPATSVATGSSTTFTANSAVLNVTEIEFGFGII